MAPKKDPIALQAHTISCHSAMGHLSILWQLIRDGDKGLQCCLTAGGGRGLRADALVLLGVRCLTFRKAQQNIFVIDVTQVRPSKPGI